MSINFNTPLGRFRLVALLEGISFILLLLVGMPLKYLAGQPLGVKYFGWFHGLLFVLFMLALLQVWLEERWKFSRVILAFACSLLPFGPFYFESRLRREIVK